VRLEAVCGQEWPSGGPVTKAEEYCKSKCDASWKAALLVAGNAELPNTEKNKKRDRSF